MTETKTTKMTRKAAFEITGSLSDPSKMPAWSYGTPAEECITGSKLRKVKGSVCENCYALQPSSNYVRFKKNVKPAQYKRLQGIEHPDWVKAMVIHMRAIVGNVPFFRWHDSGDLQSVEHLRKLVAIAVLVPEMKFWLPTREYAMVREYLASGGQIPKNLVIRNSAHMVDGPAPNIAGLPKSTVHSDPSKVPQGAKECLAYLNDDECGDCRACWDASVEWVSYLEH